MKVDEMDFPHPLLSVFSEDYVDSSFSLELCDNADNGADLAFKIRCDLNCEGLQTLIQEGKAKAVVRLVCYRTSYRDVFPVDINEEEDIKISKSKVADKLELRGMIVASEDLDAFNLPEFNHELFGDTEFTIRKGDILAEEPGIRIALDSLSEPNLPGVVQIRNGDVPNIKVHYASNDESNPNFSDYIYITMPTEKYREYAALRLKKYLKSGIDRALMASVALPAVVEGVAKLRAEELADEVYEVDYGDENCNETKWAYSIYDALRKKGFDKIYSSGLSDYEIANYLLGGVAEDAISNLKQKAEEWSQINMEDSDR